MLEKKAILAEEEASRASALVDAPGKTIKVGGCL